MGVFDSIKGMFGGNDEAVTGATDKAVDAAAGAVKEKTPDQLDGAVDQGGQMTKDAIKDQLD